MSAADDWAQDEWWSAVRDLSEAERAPHDDPQTYADTMDLDGNRR